MDIYYLLVQRSLWTMQLLISFLLSSEGRHYRRNHGRHQPEILPGEENVSVHRYEQVVLHCSVRNRETKDVQWRIVNQSFPLSIGKQRWTSDDNISVDYKRLNRTDESFDLVIKNAQPRHSNVYECQIVTLENKKRYVYLSVKPRRIIMPTVEVNGTAYIDIYQTINLTCYASGIFRAPEKVDWFHEGNIIDEGDPRWGGRLSIYETVPSGRWLISLLIIVRSRLSDQGQYVCRSSENEARSFQVSILDTRTFISSRSFGGDGVPPKIKRTDRLLEQTSDQMFPNSDNDASKRRSNVFLVLFMIVLTFS